MALKRQPEDGKLGSEGCSPGEKRARIPSLRNVVLEATRMNAIQKILAALEPLIRKVVKEEIEIALRKHLANMKQNCSRQVHPSTSRSLRLQFMNKLSLPVFTGTKLEGEDCSAIRVALVDALSGQVVNSGPESLAKVEIVVLEGDFEGDEEDNWTIEDFRNNMVREREGKRPLLTGDAFLNLSEGTGIVGDLVFTDNSSWTRSRKFRLGARVVDSNCDGIRVREAKTEPFMVKDHRGELYKKHYPPSLVDEVWRLEKIGKDGAFHKRLRSENINTVKDFLTLLFLDTPRLRNILGTGMSAKMWEVTVDHAQTCMLDNRMFVYYPHSAQRGMGVVFNIVGQVLGFLSEQKYIPIDKLSENEKVEAPKLVKVAFENWEEVVPWEDGSIMSDSSELPAVCFPSSSSVVESSYSNKLSSSHKSDEFGFNQSNILSPDITPSVLSIGGVRSLDHYALQGVDSMDLRYEHPSSFPTSALIGDMESISQTFYGDDPVQYFDPENILHSHSLELDSQDDLRSAVSSFLAMRSAATDKAQAQTRWTMLFGVLRWRFSIRRILASKKRGVRRRYG